MGTSEFDILDERFGVVSGVCTGVTDHSLLERGATTAEDIGYLDGVSTPLKQFHRGLPDFRMIVRHVAIQREHDAAAVASRRMSVMTLEPVLEGLRCARK
jgi:hypothetical protein